MRAVFILLLSIFLALPNGVSAADITVEISPAPPFRPMATPLDVNTAGGVAVDKIECNDGTVIEGHILSMENGNFCVKIGPIKKYIPQESVISINGESIEPERDKSLSKIQVLEAYIPVDEISLPVGLFQKSFTTSYYGKPTYEFRLVDGALKKTIFDDSSLSITSDGYYTCNNQLFSYSSERFIFGNYDTKTCCYLHIPSEMKIFPLIIGGTKSLLAFVPGENRESVRPIYKIDFSSWNDSSTEGLYRKDVGAKKSKVYQVELSTFTLELSPEALDIDFPFTSTGKGVRGRPETGCYNTADTTMFPIKNISAFDPQTNLLEVLVFKGNMIPTHLSWFKTKKNSGNFLIERVCTLPLQIFEREFSDTYGGALLIGDFLGKRSNHLCAVAWEHEKNTVTGAGKTKVTGTLISSNGTKSDFSFNISHLVKTSAVIDIDDDGVDELIMFSNDKNVGIVNFRSLL